MKPSSPVVVGIDIGGSKTHGVRAEGGRIIAEARVGSANAASMGLGEATRQLDALFDQLGLDQLGLDQLGLGQLGLDRPGRDGVAAVCAGAAGADSPQSRRRLRALLQQRLPGAAVEVVHDGALILAAAGLTDGVAVISGTGSVAWGVRGGAVARAGGWGHLLADEGSGCWVGRQAVRHALAGVDRGAEPDALSAALTAECGLRSPAELLDHFYATPQPRYCADLAHVAFDRAAAGDEAASAIITAAADALAELATDVCRRVGLPGPVVLGGGLAVHQPALGDIVRRRLAARGITDVRTLADAPVHGAVRLAGRLLDADGPGAGARPASPAIRPRENP